MNTHSQLSHRHFFKRSGMAGLEIASAARLKYADDLFTYTPPERNGVAGLSQEAHQWIGLFECYYPKADDTVSADGSLKYCECAAVLARVVFAIRDLFLGIQ